MIRAENLTKKFGDLTAVDNLNFEIRKNEIFGLLGPNGAGKTTTINLICGLLEPTQGKVIFDDLPGKSWKSSIGYCPQENIFYPKLTCLEQLLFIGQMYGVHRNKLRQGALELLDLTGLSEKRHELASRLSGGMKRRLNICLAMIHNPPVLVLDEPEAGLDPQSRILIRHFIQSSGREKTVILTTHNMDEADRMSDRVAIMDQGKLLCIDTPLNLKRTVGEGDILEITVEFFPEDGLKGFFHVLNVLNVECKVSEETILLKHLNIINLLPDIKGLAESSGLRISEIRLRENTLEDVFIHLTGKNLRS